MHFVHCIKSLEDIYFLQKFVRYLQPPEQIIHFLLFLLAFTSADIIFHKFLELHSILSEKNISVTNFTFSTDSLIKLAHPFNDQNLLRMSKVFG